MDKVDESLLGDELRLVPVEPGHQELVPFEFEDTKLALVGQRLDHELSSAESIDEVIAVRDDAESVRSLLKTRRQSRAKQNKFASIKLEAERKLGSILASVLQRGRPKRFQGGTFSDGPSKKGSIVEPFLEKHGITKTESWRLQLEAEVPPHKFQEYIVDATKRNDDITSAGLIRIAKEIRRERDGAPPLPPTPPSILVLVNQRVSFGTIYADPWGILGDGPENTEWLASLPIGELAGDKCHLHLWVPTARLFCSRRIISAWGFKYASMSVWIATEEPSSRGPYWKDAHMLCLLGVRGDAPFLTAGLSSWFDAPSRDNEKPSEMDSAKSLN